MARKCNDRKLKYTWQAITAYDSMRTLIQGVVQLARGGDDKLLGGRDLSRNEPGEIPKAHQQTNEVDQHAGASQPGAQTPCTIGILIFPK